MTYQEAKALKVGDSVITANGPYVQNGKVLRIEDHERHGFWIHYSWTSPDNRIKFGRKRHVAVYLPAKEELRKAIL